MLTRTNNCGTEKHIDVHVNERVDKVMERYASGARDDLTVYLHHVIEDYRKCMEHNLKDYIVTYVQRINSMTAGSADTSKKAFMLWINDNTPQTFQGYMRCQYPVIEDILSGKANIEDINLSIDVLKKSGGQYKTLVDIGIRIDKPENTASFDWFQGWQAVAERMKDFLEIYETHAHYNMDQYKACRETILEEMHESGIARCVVPSVEAYRRDGQGHLINVNRQMVDMLGTYDWIRFGLGSHPKYLWKDPDLEDARWQDLEQQLSNPKCVAVGEAGLDYSYPNFDEEHKKRQEEFFVRFIELANAHQLPMILHIRPAIDSDTGNVNPAADMDALRIMKQHPIRNGAVCHCFGGDWALAQKYMDYGVTHFGIGGRILKDEARLTDAVEHMPEKCIVLETDAPYINTVGIYGPNTSYALLPIAEKIAEIRRKSTEYIIRVTYDNAMRLFKDSE